LRESKGKNHGEGVIVAKNEKEKRLIRRKEARKIIMCNHIF
jgi:hypothetical protein